MNPDIPVGDCIRIDRKTGAIMQVERQTPESLARAIDQIARIWAAGLLAQKKEALYATQKEERPAAATAERSTPEGCHQYPG